MNRKGFTLIEFVLALGLAAILAGVLGGVLRGAVGTWRDMRETSRARQRAHALYGRLGRDLRNSLSLPGETFKGTAEQIIFNTLMEMSPTPESLETVPSIARVSYREDLTPAGIQLVLDQQRYSTGFDVEPLAQRVIIPADVKFSFAYWGGPDRQVLWEDVWIDTGTFPRAVKAELVFPSKKGPIRYESVFQNPLGVLPSWNK